MTGNIDIEKLMKFYYSPRSLFKDIVRTNEMAQKNPQLRMIRLPLPEIQRIVFTQNFEDIEPSVKMEILEFENPYYRGYSAYKESEWYIFSKFIEHFEVKKI